jgi:DNA polymerase I
MAKLYLIDGMSLVFRAYFALQRSGLRSPTGEPTFAVFSFINIITSILERENPELIAVAFDRQEKTFRHHLYPAYKANRDAFPEDLIPQLKRIKELLDLLSIKQIELPGFEADDIIGTLTKCASIEGIDTACLTNDKDYYQLVDDNIRLFKPTQNQNEDFQVVDISGVKEKFGVMPS